MLGNFGILSFQEPSLRIFNGTPRLVICCRQIKKSNVFFLHGIGWQFEAEIMMARILISSGHTLVAFFHACQNALELEDLIHLFSIHFGLVSFQEQVSPVQLAIRRWCHPGSQ